MLARLEQWPISQWVATSDWGYPLLLSVHSMGMAIVVGILVMLDLRVLGVARAIPFTAFRRLMPLAWAGFVLNLVSGLLLFFSMGTRLIGNWPFLSKIGAICVGGAISWYLWQSIVADLEARQPALDRLAIANSAIAGGSQLDISARSKRLAIASLLVWFSAILFGRLIAYVLDAALLAGEFG